MLLHPNMMTLVLSYQAWSAMFMAMDLPCHVTLCAYTSMESSEAQAVQFVFTVFSWLLFAIKKSNLESKILPKLGLIGCKTILEHKILVESTPSCHWASQSVFLKKLLSISSCHASNPAKSTCLKGSVTFDRRKLKSCSFRHEKDDEEIYKSIYLAHHEHSRSLVGHFWHENSI